MVLFSSDCVLKAERNILSSSEAKTDLVCSAHSRPGFLNQARPVSHSLPLSSSSLICLALISAGLWKLLTCFHWEKSVLSSHSATRLATNTCCLWGGLGIHCSSVVESDQKLKQGSSSHVPWQSDLSISLSWHLLVIPNVALKDVASVRLHFPIANVKSAEYSLDSQDRYATAHILSYLGVSGDKKLFLAVLKYLLSTLVFAITGTGLFI